MRLLSRVLVLISLFQMSVGQAKVLDSTFTSNLFSVQTFLDDGDSVDGLFDPKPKMGVGVGIGPIISPDVPDQSGNGPVPGKPTTPPANPGTPSNPGTNTPSVVVPPTVVRPPMTTSPNVKDSFKCNLFENSEYADLLSSVNALNQAISSPSCGNSDVNVAGIITSNKTILDALKTIHQTLGMDQAPQDPNSPVPAPGTVTFPGNLDELTKDSAKVTTVINQVDLAIRAAASLAKAFGSNDLLKKECRDQMGSGDVAVALSNIINGLTPYALMASSLTGGTAAVPWIVGGTVLTSTISSIGKIITENSFNVRDASVRRAIIENTCQFIRMDQKYKFLIQNRREQTTRISNEIKASQYMFYSLIKDLPPEISQLMASKNQLDQVAKSLETKISSANSQLAADKQFITGTSDDIKICQLGVQLAVINQDQSSYVHELLASVETASQSYGNTNIPQARALKLSSDYAINSLIKIAQEPFTTSSNFEYCAKLTKSFVETLEQSGTLAKRLVSTAQANLNKELMKNKDYAQVQSQMRLLEQKQTLAENVTNSLENLRSYANSFTQSEINAEMDRLRQGLFGSRGFLSSGSPVMAWFDYTKQLHAASVTKFKDSLRSLRLRAYGLTAEAKTGKNAAYALSNGPLTSPDQTAAYQLLTFNKKNLPVGSTAHTDACRELKDVWSRWVIAIDHLSAIESLCSMINPYIYDNRNEDRLLVVMCRGVQANAPGGFQTPSTLEVLKNGLIKDKARDWSLYVKSTIDNLSCPQAEEN